MVSLHETEHESSGYRQPNHHHAQYQNSVGGNVDARSTATMSDEQQPKAMSVQERIRALNKEAAKPARMAPPPMKLRSTAPWAKATAPAPVPSGTPVEKERSVEQLSPNANMQEMPEQEIIGQIDVRDAEVRDQIDVCDAHLHYGTDDESQASNSDESKTNESEDGQEECETDVGNFNTLHQFMLDSALGDGLQSEVSEGDGEDFDASAALRYWRKSKGTGDADGESNDDEEVIIGKQDESTVIRDNNEDYVQAQDSGLKNEETSRCENDDEMPSSQKDEPDIKSDLEITSTQTDEYLGEIEPEVQPSRDEVVQDIADAFDSLTLETDRGTDEPGLQIEDAQGCNPPSPPDILRTVHSYPNMDNIEKDEGSEQAEYGSQFEQNDEHVGLLPGGIEQTENEPEQPSQGPVPGRIKEDDPNAKQHHRGSKSSDEAAESEKEKPGQDQSSKMEKPRHQPRTASTFSQRAFEKRSRMRAAQNAQNAQAAGPNSPRAKERTKKDPETAKGTESTAEVDNASVFSGSTTHSASTIHTTTLSSRATRLLREKRKGNAKTDGLAKALAQNILRGKPATGDKPKTSSQEENVKSNAQPSTVDDFSTMHVSAAGTTPSDIADKSIGVSVEHNSRQQQYTTTAPVGMGERHYSNLNFWPPPLDYQFQRQQSHVSHHSNISQHAHPIQFGPSPSFQNVEVGISSGPTVYQMQQQQTISQYISPVAGIPYAGHPSHGSRVYAPNRGPPNSDLLVQPKFSRFNSFDVQNPKPPPIQNVLTEDSASWSESRTQDGTVEGSAGGTQSSQFTPQESIGGVESVGVESESIHHSTESIPHLDSFPKGRSFDKGCIVFDHIQNACDALSPKSCNPEIVSNPTIQSNEIIHVGSTFSNMLSDEDVAIEVEYVERNDAERTDERDFDANTIESDSVYSMSTRDMDSEDSYSSGNA